MAVSDEVAERGASRFVGNGGAMDMDLGIVDERDARALDRAVGALVVAAAAALIRRRGRDPSEFDDAVEFADCFRDRDLVVLHLAALHALASEDVALVRRLGGDADDDETRNTRERLTSSVLDEFDARNPCERG